MSRRQTITHPDLELGARQSKGLIRPREVDGRNSHYEIIGVFHGEDILVEHCSECAGMLHTPPGFFGRFPRCTDQAHRTGVAKTPPILPKLDTED